MYVDDLTRLHHILDAIREAQGFVAGKTRAALDTDRLLSRGLIQCVQIVGEAAKNVSRNYQTAHPEVPWKRLVDARNDLVHHYFQIDLDAVWEAVTHELPACVPDLERLIAELEGA